MSRAVLRWLAPVMLLGLSHAAVAAAPLALDVYNPGEAAIFPVSSVLVSGEKEAVLIDAQFARPQAEQLVKKIQSSGKRLKTIYISHGDPDYYFGLQTLAEAFPQADIVATAQTVAHIRATRDDKLAYWGPKLGQDAPREVMLPKVMTGNTLRLEGRELQVIGLDGAQPDRTFVWIPSIKAVVGGVVLSNNIHVWMADTQTAQSRTDWLKTLEHIQQLDPVTVVPGHYLAGRLAPAQAPAFTARYVKDFIEQSAKAKDSTALIKAMTGLYPGLADEASLDLSAKVDKGEMAW